MKLPDKIADTVISNFFGYFFNGQSVLPQEKPCLRESVLLKILLKAHGKGLVPTDLSVAIPKNCYGRVGMIFILSLSFYSTSFWISFKEVY